MPVPTFIGAFVGSDDRLPTWQHAYSDPRALAATELMVRLLRERSAYEANLFDENNAFLVAASVFPYFYALVGERNPKLAPRQGPRSPYSPLACDAFELIQRDGPISKQKLQEALGGSVSLPALDKALGELLVEAAHHARRLQGRRRLVLGCPLPLGAGCCPRRRGTIGAAGALGAALEISGLRHRRRAKPNSKLSSETSSPARA